MSGPGRLILRAPTPSRSAIFNCARYTYRIEGQDGKRFWGTASSDLVANERLVGSLSNDGKWIYMAGQDGILDGQIVDADTIEMCYRHAYATSAVVGCNRMKRVK